MMAPRYGLPAEKNFSLRDTFALGRVNLWVERLNRVLDLLMLVRHGISLGVDNNINTLRVEKYLGRKGKGQMLNGTLAHALSARHDERRARRQTAYLVRMAMLSPHGVLHIRLYRIEFEGGPHTNNRQVQTEIARPSQPTAANGVGKRDSLAW